jgi:hypothetical protein
MQWFYNLEPSNCVPAGTGTQLIWCSIQTTAVHIDIRTRAFCQLLIASFIRDPATASVSSCVLQRNWQLFSQQGY